MDNNIATFHSSYSDFSYSPANIMSSIWKHRDLIWQLVKRDLSERYKGTYLGVIWAFVTPLTMLAIYSFVFSVIFQGSWIKSDGEARLVEFALTLFAGLIPFQVFSEVAIRAPGLVLAVPNFVKKVIFPLEILPVVTVISSSLHSLFSIAILLVGNLIVTGKVSSTLVLLPLAYLPLLFLCLGLAWFLASLGVYLRDIGQFVGLVVQILFFMSPVFYPVNATPASIRWFFYFNPLTAILNAFRESLLWSSGFDWKAWLIWLGLLMGGSWLGYIWFMKTKKGFADAL